MPVIATTGAVTAPEQQFVRKENNRVLNVKQKKNPYQYSQKEAGAYQQFIEDETAEVLAKIHLEEQEVASEFALDEVDELGDTATGDMQDIDEDANVLQSALNQLALQRVQEQDIYKLARKFGFQTQYIDPAAHQLRRDFANPLAIVDVEHEGLKP